MEDVSENLQLRVSARVTKLLGHLESPVKLSDVGVSGNVLVYAREYTVQ